LKTFSLYVFILRGERYHILFKDVIFYGGVWVLDFDLTIFLTAGAVFSVWAKAFKLFY
jgi:hypothetical protein